MSPRVEKRLFYLLDKAHRKLFRHLDQACQQQLDLSLPQLGALLYLCEQPGSLQKQLADALDLNKSAITGLLGRMEANQLIERRTDTTDARAIRVYASAQGKLKAAAAKPLIDQLNQLLGQSFTRAELDTVLRFLNFVLGKF